jgi:hypothetical protein
MVWNPWTGEEEPQAMPGGGRGYLRTPSLVSLWSTAPLFHDNGLGRFSGDPSVAGRMAAFDDAMDRLLWPARRAGDDCEETWGEPFCGPVPRTTRESWLTLRAEVLPASLARLLAGEMEDGALRVGPVPEGTPVALLASLDLELTPERLPRIAGLLLALRRDLGRIERQGLGPEESREVLRGLVPRLRALGGCLDYRVDRGHTFGAGLPDADKRALIEFLKTV